jgi:hypothetical protein
MVNPCCDKDPRSCQDYKVRKKLYDLLVHGGYISVMKDSKFGDRIIEIAKEMIIERNRDCVVSGCFNINACTSAIEEESPLKLPKDFFSLNRPDIQPRTLKNFAFNIMKRAVGKA